MVRRCPRVGLVCVCTDNKIQTPSCSWFLASESRGPSISSNFTSAPRNTGEPVWHFCECARISSIVRGLNDELTGCPCVFKLFKSRRRLYPPPACVFGGAYAGSSCHLTRVRRR